MNNQLQIFNNSQFGEVRVAGTSEQPMFCLVDVCKALGIQNPSRVATEVLDDDLRQTYPIVDTLGREQSATFVNEGGLYAVVLRSERPEAKEFRKWVTSVVLPSIRKHGAYLTPDTVEKLLDDPDTVIQLLTNIKQERAKRMEVEKQVAHLIPKAALMDKVMDSDQKIDIGQAAKILQLPFGRNTLFNKLREKGVFFKNRNEPKQEHIDRGYFELKEKWIDRHNHDGFMVVKVLVTQKGLDYIARLFEVIPTAKTLARLT